MIARRLVLSSILVMLAISMICWTSEGVRAQGSISVFTDKSSYQLHEPVTFHGYVSGASDVMVYIYTPDVDPHVHKESFDWAIRREGVSGYYSCTYNGERTNNKVGTWTANAVMYHPTHPGEKLGEAWVTWEVVGEGQTQPPPEVKKLSIIVETTLGDTYQPDEDVFFSGRVTCNGAGVEGANIEMVVSNSAGESGTPGHTVTESRGFYGSKIHLPEDIVPGTYTITVTASKEGYQPASAKTAYTVLVNEADVLLVTVDVSSEFKPGDYVIVNVFVNYKTTSGYEPVSGAVVSLSVSPSIGLSSWTAKADPGGHEGVYDGGFTIPANARPDVYTLTVTASKKGYETGSDSTSFTVKGTNTLGVRPVESVGGGIAGIASGIGGPSLISKAVSMVRGTGGATETTTEPPTEPTEAIQFTDPHEEPESTYWEEEKDPVKRRTKQQEEKEKNKKRQKWLDSLSEEDRTAETGRIINGQSVQDEYVQTMNDRPDFMKRIDEQERAESKANGTRWGDDWIVSKVNDGDLRTMSGAERTQYDQWVKRFDSFTRRHGSSRNWLRTTDGRYNRKEFGSGGTRG